VILAIAILAALLAFPLRSLIYSAVVVPLAYLGWELSLYYHAFSQVVWWWVIAGIVFFMLIFSLFPDYKPRERKEPKPNPKHGQVEDLAIWLERARGGIYFKWLIANRLGKLAYQILQHRESGRVRSAFAPLVGTDWEPSPALRQYLETGLHGSFSDFPNNGRFFSTPPQTPLDYEVRNAVDFLESQVENSNDK
jgi:hypothetical protein